jgi:hypothetical protein
MMAVATPALTCLNDMTAGARSIRPAAGLLDRDAIRMSKSKGNEPQPAGRLRLNAEDFSSAGTFGSYNCSFILYKLHSCKRKVTVPTRLAP